MDDSGARCRWPDPQKVPVKPIDALVFPLILVLYPLCALALLCVLLYAWIHDQVTRIIATLPFR